MNTSYMKVLLVIMGIFSLIGIACGLIIHSELPQTLKDASTINNCYIFMVISITYVALFCSFYLGWEILHHHKELDIKRSTKMF